MPSGISPAPTRKKPAHCSILEGDELEVYMAVPRGWARGLAVFLVPGYSEVVPSGRILNRDNTNKALDYRETFSHLHPYDEQNG